VTGPARWAISTLDYKTHLQEHPAGDRHPPACSRPGGRHCACRASAVGPVRPVSLDFFTVESDAPRFATVRRYGFAPVKSPRPVICRAEAGLVNAASPGTPGDRPGSNQFTPAGSLQFAARHCPGERVPRDPAGSTIEVHRRERR
jgi:hypothetical protein